ncbi:hypothetical protein WA158_003544 [Blastocystis sp. Blastoise]
MSNNNDKWNDFRKQMMGCINEFIDLQIGTKKIDEKLDYLDSNMESFLRHRALECGIPVNYTRSATITISNVLRYIPFVLSVDDRMDVFNLFRIEEGSVNFSWAGHGFNIG